MLYKTIHIKDWKGTFLFSTGGYDNEEIYRQLVYCDAPDSIFSNVSSNLERGSMVNEGFTFSSPFLRRSVVYIGPATSGGEFMSSFSHEIAHFAIDICVTDGIDLEDEKLAYLIGEVTLQLSDIACRMSCDKCRRE